ncbi:hypothetical protein BDF19DRAFT_440950 [Syncephalis fuscata]|nr:hypothetical protein BDF19DRAFT_440950 [Syncephalis fuscata]
MSSFAIWSAVTTSWLTFPALASGDKNSNKHDGCQRRACVTGQTAALNNRNNPTDTIIHANSAKLQNLKEEVPLWDKLWSPATVVTMERKYAVCPCVAEFWCSITSIAFASPILIYLFVPYNLISWQIHVCCIFGILSASASTIYHWTLFKLFSSLDAAIACTTMHVFMLLVLGECYPYQSWIRSSSFWISNVVLVLAYILHRWENTAKPAVQVISFSATLFSWGLMQLEEWYALVFGWLGIICFLVDRKNMVAAHSIWHIGGGLSLGLAAWAVIYRQIADN